MGNPKPLSQSELLQWAVLKTATQSEDASSSSTSTQPVQRDKIDPKWVDVILGRNDAVLMKECVEKLEAHDLNAVADLDEQLAVFDELQMLVESIDNSNDLRPLALWQPIMNILSSHKSPKMRMYAAWVIGTAVQNNETAQKDFLELNLLQPLLASLETDSDPEVVAKCVTCLSGLTNNNTTALDKARSVLGQGFLPLMRILSNQTMEKAHKRLLFYLNSLVETAVGQDVFDDAVAGTWGEHVLGLLKFESVDVDTVEKAFSLLIHILKNDPNSLIIIPEVRQNLKTQIATLQTTKFRSNELDADMVNAINSYLP